MSMFGLRALIPETLTLAGIGVVPAIARCRRRTGPCRRRRGRDESDRCACGHRAARTPPVIRRTNPSASALSHRRARDRSAIDVAINVAIDGRAIHVAIGVPVYVAIGRTPVDVAIHIAARAAAAGAAVCAVTATAATPCSRLLDRSALRLQQQ